MCIRDSLIGTLQTYAVVPATGSDNMFQSLIGTLQTKG